MTRALCWWPLFVFHYVVNVLTLLAMNPYNVYQDGDLKGHHMAFCRMQDFSYCLHHAALDIVELIIALHCLINC